MLILTIRTDIPEAEIGLYNDQAVQVSYEKWQAHRELAKTIHIKIKELLDKQNKTVHDLDGIACFQGPGSFTGLRIGLSVANSLSNELKIPIFGSAGNDWISDSVSSLLNGKKHKIVLPEYGSPAFVTKPKGC